MGMATFKSKEIPVLTDADEAVDISVIIGGKPYKVTCVNVGNPHCVVFCDSIDTLDLQKTGPEFENAEIFPERINTEFVRVINRTTLRMRVWERGNGETLACGTGACAAVAAAIKNGFCDEGRDITIKLAGGDLTVNCTDERLTLTGATVEVFSGKVEI
jgi:carbamoyl-phosphate synthase large subunit